MKQPYPEPKPGSPRPLGACVIQDIIPEVYECNHKWILTSRIPDCGGYTNGVNGKDKFADFEFVCPECGEIKVYTKLLNIQKE